MINYEAKITELEKKIDILENQQIVWDKKIGWLTEQLFAMFPSLVKEQTEHDAKTRPVGMRSGHGIAFGADLHLTREIDEVDSRRSSTD